MIFNRYEWRIAVRILLLFGLLCLAAWLVMHRYWLYLSVTGMTVVAVLYNLYKMHMKTLKEIEQF